MASSASGPSGTAPQPLDASAMRRLLASMGVDDYQPRVVHQLLEFMQQYTADIFAESETLAEHAGRAGQLECEDVHLSARLRAAANQTSAPQLMEWMARSRNREPLTAPAVPNVQLPHPRLCLVEENYQLAPRTRAAVAPPAGAGGGGDAAAAARPGARPQTATARKQIAINLGSAAMDVSG